MDELVVDPVHRDAHKIGGRLQGSPYHVGIVNGPSESDPDAVTVGEVDSVYGGRPQESSTATSRGLSRRGFPHQLRNATTAANSEASQPSPNSAHMLVLTTSPGLAAAEFRRLLGRQGAQVISRIPAALGLIVDGTSA